MKTEWKLYKAKDITPTELSKPITRMRYFDLTPIKEANHENNT